MRPKRNNITAFIQSLGGGGAQGVLVTIMNYYKSLGYDITIVVESMKNDVNSPNLDIDIHIFSMNVSSTKSALKGTIDYIKKNAMDYVFAFSPEIAVNLYMARLISRKKYIIIGRCINTLSIEYKQADTFFRKHISKNLVKLFYGKIDRVVVQADNMGRDLIENFNVAAKKVYVINNPLSVKYESIIDDEKIYKKEDYILYVGRLEKQKGLMMLIDAYSQIDDKQVELKLVGKGSMKAELMEYAEKKGLKEKIRFVDFTSNVEDYYKRARATVMSSCYEGFPNVLSESIACGTPVASFDLPSGPRDIVIEGINGYLAEYLNVDSLTEAINKTLSQNWNSLEVKNTARRFTRDRILEGYKRVLEGI
ncbi:MAG: glycosyltransferase [Acetatifactor sp.]|nr:glycosyltransferase [Acetatifactor sp.]